MKITHNTKVNASEDFVVDYKIPDDPEYVKREERKRMQRELADEEDAYDLEHEEGIYSATDAAPAIKPSGGDMINYVMVYTGPGYEENTPQAVLEWGKSQGFDKMYWGSDTAYGMQGMYNGDTYILYKDAEKLPAGYKADALDAEAHDRVMSSSIIECATQEEMQKAFAEYQKKQQEMMMQLDDMQNDQMSKFNKRTQPKKKGLFQRAFGSEDAPVCHKINEDADSIDYIVSSENITATKWMGKYLDTKGQVKKVYFDFDSEDWNEAEQEFEDIIPEPYQSCKLLGVAPAGIEKENDFSYIEGATRQITGQLLGELQAQLHYETHRYLVDVGGFDEAPDPNDRYSMPADDMFVVDVHKEEGGAVVAEVRAELGYDSMEKLADVLNDKVIQKYDPNSYFEQVEPGIMEAWLFNSDIEGTTKVVGAHPVTDTRDHWLEPEDEDDLDELPPYQETIEVELDVDIDIEDDGSYDYESYDFARNDSFNGDYYVSYDALADKIKLRDYMSVVEDIDELLAYELPDVKGKHHISGIAELVYDVDGLVRDNSDGLVYAYDLKITFNRSDSEIKRFRID